MTDGPNESFQCSECQAGMMHMQHITYFTWLDEELHRSKFPGLGV